MELSRQEYPNLLASLQPAQAVNVLNDRVRLINKVNTDIADWLSERRKVEEAYAQGLRRLSKRPQQDGAAALGIFQTPWQRIVGATEEIAQSHESFAARIDTDVETPLRQFSTKNREMQSMGTIQGNLSSLVRELETAQKRQDKIKDKKGPSADRIAHANITADETQAQWDSQAPYVFEQLQAADEARLNHLRDVLTQYQTHEADHTERNRAAAESCLNALLSVETADEIASFAARTVGEGRNRSRRQSAATAPAPPAAANVPPMPPPPRKTEARPPPMMASPSQERLKSESSRHGALGGIKRLGTVMSRRKSQAPPSNVASPEKPKKSRGFAPFRREDSSKSFRQMADSPPPGVPALTPMTSRGEVLSPQASQALPEPIQPRVAEQPVSVSPNDVDEITPAPGAMTGAPMTNGNVAYDTGRLAPETSEQPPLPAIPQYEQPPRLDPISQAQQEAYVYNGENEDALRSLTIRDKPIQEDEGEANAALNTIANQLRLQARQSHLRPQSSVRGRRDVRNTIFVPNPEPNEAPNGLTGLSTGALAGSGTDTQGASPPSLASPIAQVKRTGTLPEDRASDANSIHSSHTLSSIGGAFGHPDLHEPGLSASIVETVSTWFANGAVTKSFAIGEVALAYNPTADGEIQPNETIRLDNFQLLEKVAANPSFVTANSSDKGKAVAGSEDNAGEYSLNLSAITKPTPAIAFKYQLHFEPDTPSIYSPVLLTTAWQIQETQASIIIGYSLNPAFSPASAPATTTLTLKNFALTVNIDTTNPESGKASTAMMAPQNGATFRKKQSTVVWKLPELNVVSEPQRFLARFITTGPAKHGHVEAKWELQGQTGSSLGVSVISGASADVDPFADESGAGASGTLAGATKTWAQVPVVRKLVTGRYTA